MIKLRSKVFLAAAVTVLAASALLAQTSAVGADGYTRLLWRGTDGSISVWRLDANLNHNPSDYKQYGPYVGWTPLAITTGLDNITRVLWKATDGRASLWNLDANLNYMNNGTYGPFFGWTPESISIDENNYLRLIWRETNGAVSVWEVLPNLSYNGMYKQYGPYFGWDPGTAAAKVKQGASVSADNNAVSINMPDSSDSVTPK